MDKFVYWNWPQWNQKAVIHGSFEPIGDNERMPDIGM